MATSKIAEGLEKLIVNLSKLVGRLQVGVSKILWGQPNVRPATAVQYGTTPTSGNRNVLSYSSQIPTDPSNTSITGNKIKNFAQSGVFNILNALNSVDLCEIMTYAYDNINLRKRPRPENPQGIEKLFYGIQDVAGEVVKCIDKYTAYPNTLINSFIGVGVEAIPPVLGGTDNTAAPTQGGLAVTKYNTYFLMQTIKELFTFGTDPNSLLTSEQADILTSVPGFASKINFVRDFTGIVDQYTDYRQIPDERVQYLINKINEVRSICTAIQALNFTDPRGTINIVGNYLGVDVRSQIQQLNKYVDVTKIVPTLKQVNNTLTAFIRIARQAQGIVNIGQFFIKLAILFYRVFRFIINFFSALPAPTVFFTVGLLTVIQSAKERAKSEADGVMRVLQALNSLLSVVVDFIKYLLVNTIELLARLEILLARLEACESMKNSDVLFQLQQTYVDLSNLKEQLETYIIGFESKTDPKTAEFGKYQIRVIDEQLVETTVINRRRRGVALDINGRIVAQSDLTFATNTAIIIEEVKQKLVSIGLVQPTIPRLDSNSLAIIAESLNFLDNSDVLSNDLNITEADVESVTNLDENQGIGLQAFINNLKGGKRLRERVRKKLKEQQNAFNVQIEQEKQAAQNTVNASIATARSQGKTLYKFRVVVDAPLIIGPYVLEATNKEQAITFARKLADPRNNNPTWTYTATQL